MTINFSLPLRVRTSKKKEFILNLNNYRNAYFRTLSVAKNNYQDIVQEIAPKIPYLIINCEVKIVLFPKSRRKMDVGNSCSICEKFMLDGLTKKGYWKDDDYLTIPRIVYEFGEVDKDNPRFEIEILVKTKAPN